MKKVTLVVSIFCLFFFLTGCVTRLGDFTVLSTKNIEWERADTFQREKPKERLKADSIMHIVIFIPFGIANIEEAADKAIESFPGAVALVDAVVYQTFWWIPYIYGQGGYIVKGTPLIDPNLAQGEKMENDTFYIGQIDESGVFTKKKVSFSDYSKITSRLF